MPEPTESATPHRHTGEAAMVGDDFILSLYFSGLMSGAFSTLRMALGDDEATDQECHDMAESFVARIYDNPVARAEVLDMVRHGGAGFRVMTL